ncbi:MAG: DUF86 domain-containing protein [Desulfohalobiaceae bacterium]|nr:DUF86 domain-containing protein [Desulfohalobiaceae bacterium]
MIPERIEQKKARILEYIQVLRGIQDDCLERFDTDPLYRGALLHYLYLMADSCIALAELVIKHKSLRLPQTYSEAFDILGDNRVIDPEFAYNFAKIAGFRNLLAHDYETIDGRRICTALLQGLNEVEQYISQIQKALA